MAAGPRDTDESSRDTPQPRDGAERLGGEARHLGLGAAAIARAPAHSARCTAPQTATHGQPQTAGRRAGLCLSERVACRPDPPLFSHVCSVTKQAHTVRARQALRRGRARRAAGVTFSVYGVCIDSVYGPIRPAPKPARRPLTYKTARPTNRPTRWGRPAAEAAQCEGRRNGGARPHRPEHVCRGLPRRALPRSEITRLGERLDRN